MRTHFLGHYRLRASGEGICFEDPKHPRLIAGGTRREAVGGMSEAKV